MLTAETVRRSWRDWWSLSLRPCGPGWLQLLWTTLFSTGIAVLLTLFAWGFARHPNPLKFFGQNFVIAQTIGLTIHALFEAGGYLIGVERIQAFSRRTRLLFFMGIPSSGC